MTLSTKNRFGKLVIVLLMGLFWVGVASTLVSLSGCSSKPVTDGAVLAAAQPKPSADVNLKPAGVSARDTDEALDRLGKQVDEAEREAEEAQRLNQKQVLTIAELREQMRMTDEDVDARVIAVKESARVLVARLEADIKERGELDERRQVTISTLKEELKMADASNKVTIAELFEKGVELRMTKNELASYRDMYPIAVAAVKSQEKKMEAMRDKAAKNQYWADSWWKWCIGASLLTSVLWVAGLVYLSITMAPPAFARNVARKVLFTG